MWQTFSHTILQKSPCIQTFQQTRGRVFPKWGRLIRSKWRWTIWKSGTEANKTKEASQGDSFDRIAQNRSTENIPKPDRCSENPLAAAIRHGFKLAAVNFIADMTLSDSRLIKFVLFEFLTFL